jgi:hypothetical protein
VLKFQNFTAVPQVFWIAQRDALIFPANDAPLADTSPKE